MIFCQLKETWQHRRNCLGQHQIDTDLKIGPKCHCVMLGHFDQKALRLGLKPQPQLHIIAIQDQVTLNLFLFVFFSLLFSYCCLFWGSCCIFTREKNINKKDRVTETCSVVGLPHQSQHPGDGRTQHWCAQSQSIFSTNGSLLGTTLFFSFCKNWKNIDESKKHNIFH